MRGSLKVGWEQALNFHRPIQLLRNLHENSGATDQHRRPWSDAASMATKAWVPVFSGPCCELINNFCGTAMEIASAYRSHFTFWWSGPGCKGQLSESLYPLRPTGGLLDHDWLGCTKPVTVCAERWTVMWFFYVVTVRKTCEVKTLWVCVPLPFLQKPLCCPVLYHKLKLCACPW